MCSNPLATLRPGFALAPQMPHFAVTLVFVATVTETPAALAERVLIVEDDPATRVGLTELVGAWGISFTWNDGHATGIYPWDALRRWCDE